VLGVYDWANAVIHSLKVAPRSRVILHSRNYYKGKSEEFTSDEKCIKDLDLRLIVQRNSKKSFGNHRISPSSISYLKNW